MTFFEKDGQNERSGSRFSNATTQKYARKTTNQKKLGLYYICRKMEYIFSLQFITFQISHTLIKKLLWRQL